LDFFFGAEERGLGLNLSLGVASSIHNFNQWDWRVAKGDVVVKHDALLSFKSCSLVIGLGETCQCCATWHSWLVGGTCCYGVTILDEGTSNKGNHFLNIIFKLSLG
jgi:hypothetical protein